MAKLVSVIGVVWVKNLCCLVLRDPRFKMKINLGVVLFGSLVYAKRVSG